MALLPKVKLKTIVSFPADVFGATGIKVTKRNGQYFFDLDYSRFGIAANAPPGAIPYILSFDEASGSFLLLPYPASPVGGIPEAPTDHQAYSRKDASWVISPTGGGGGSGDMLAANNGSDFRDVTVVPTNLQIRPPAAAAGVSLFNILSERVYVENFLVPGETDFTNAIRNAAATVADNGKGVLVFRHTTYPVLQRADVLNLHAPNTGWGTNTVAHPLVYWKNQANAMTIEGNGALLTASQPDTFGGVWTVFWLEGTNHVTVENINYQQTVQTLDSAGCTALFMLSGAARDTTIRNIDMLGGRTGVACIGGSNAPSWGTGAASVQGIKIDGFQTTHIYYPFNFQFSGDYVTGRHLKTINNGRSYFPYNVHHHDIQIDTQQGGPFDDCLLKVYTVPGATELSSLYAIDLDYRTVGRYPGSGNSDNFSACVTLGIQQNDATSRAGFMKDINIRLDVSNNPLANFGDVLHVYKLDINGSADTIARGHQVSNINVRGRVRDWASSAGAFFNKPVTGIADNWSGDILLNWWFHDLELTGTGGLALNMDGRGFQNPATFERIYSSGNLSLPNFVAAYINIGKAVSFANFTKANYIVPPGLSYERDGSTTRVFGTADVVAGQNNVVITLPGGLAFRGWLKLIAQANNQPTATTTMFFPLTTTTCKIIQGNTLATQYYVDIVGIE